MSRRRVRTMAETTMTGESAAGGPAISRLTGVLGARADGVTLSPTMDPPAVAALRAALVEHEVLVVPGQDLSPEDQTGFSHLLGDYSPVPFVRPVPKHPEVIKVRGDQCTFGAEIRTGSRRGDPIKKPTGFLTHAAM